jgi:RNA polymerase sigma factor (sigma-70 family)
MMDNRLISILMKQMPTRPSVSDGELLHQFAKQRDDGSFTELVRRHGPMVWAVCRNALRSEADAEDAFQATFLTLVRQSASIKKRESLAAWLHGVAVRVCLKSRQATARRLARETRKATQTSIVNQNEVWHDDLVHVHQAIKQLPKREHAVFVLSILEGIPQVEVARQLGIQVNSVSGLLSRARKRLQMQLKSNNQQTAMAIAVAACTPAAVPAALFQLTRGLVRTTSGLSVSILSLTTTITEMHMRKSIVMMLLAAVLASGATVGSYFVSNSGAQEPGQTRFGQPVSPPTIDPSYRFSDATTQSKYSVALDQPTPQWEYKTLQSSEIKEADLNALGAKGWELCTSNVMPVTNQLSMVFKRQKKQSTTTEGYKTALDSFYGNKGKNLNPPEPENNDFTTFPLRNTSATEVAEVLKTIYKTSSILSDARTNSVLVQAPRAITAEIKQLIQRLDVKPPTVVK